MAIDHLEGLTLDPETARAVIEARMSAAVGEGHARRARELEAPDRLQDEYMRRAFDLEQADSAQIGRALLKEYAAATGQAAVYTVPVPDGTRVPSVGEKIVVGGVTFTCVSRSIPQNLGPGLRLEVPDGTRVPSAGERLIVFPDGTVLFPDGTRGRVAAKR